MGCRMRQRKSVGEVTGCRKALLQWLKERGQEVRGVTWLTVAGS